METKLITFASLKGGVGKTMHLIALAAGLADKGYTVRLLDTDPQSTVEDWLARTEHNKLSGTFYDLKNATLEQANAEIYEASQGYDFMLLDTQGSASPGLIAALLTSDLIFSPFRLTEDDVAGLYRTRKMFCDALETIGEDPAEADQLIGLFVREMAFISNADKDQLHEISNDIPVRAGLALNPHIKRWKTTARTPLQLMEGVAPHDSAETLSKNGIERSKELIELYTQEVIDLVVPEESINA